MKKLISIAMLISIVVALCSCQTTTGPQQPAYRELSGILGPKYHICKCHRIVDPLINDIAQNPSNYSFDVLYKKEDVWLWPEDYQLFKNIKGGDSYIAVRMDCEGCEFIVRVQEEKYGD